MKKKILLFVTICAVMAGCGPRSDSTVLRKIPRSQRKGLLVLNFKNNTVKTKADEFQPWEFGIASMLMTDIESIGMFNIISRERLKDVMKEQEYQLSGSVDPQKAVEMGKIVAARYILAGFFIEMNGNLRIVSQVYSVETGAQLGTAAVFGRTDTFFDLEKQLVLKLSRYMDTMLTDSEAMALARNVETKSVRASLNNYAGEIAVLKAGDLKKKGREEQAKDVLDEARSSFKKALEYDPEYERARKNLARIAMAIPVTL